MKIENDSPMICKVKGLVYGTALRGSYNSPMFKHDDTLAKTKAILDLLESCGSTVSPEDLCGSESKVSGLTCLPSTLQSAGNDDADLTLNGPDDNGNCYYNLVITGKGVVGWSAVEDTCISIAKHG
jgi:hypothetical protein